MPSLRLMEVCVATVVALAVAYTAAQAGAPASIEHAMRGDDGTLHFRVFTDSRATRIVSNAASAVLPDVAIVASASGSITDPWFTDPLNRLSATGRFASVTVIHAGVVTPSVAELMAFDAVLVWSNLALADPIALGDALADYVDVGGGVVVAVFANSSVTDGRHLAGRWLNRDYDVIPAQGGTATGAASLGVVHAPAHPLMNGVVAFSGGTSSFRPVESSVIDTGMVVAEWTDGATLVAVRDDTIGARVDLGFYPPSSAVISGFWDAATDGGTLLANALEYAATRPALTPGDADADGDVDQNDFVRFETCVTGAISGPPLAGCVTFDLDLDGDVDCDDWTLIKAVWTGPPTLPPLVDCNGNGLQDACDIAGGTSNDCTGNGQPDECEADCNNTGVADSCDILAGTSADCNLNGVPDECDAAQPDCNNNGTPDGCDITAGTSNDCNGNLVPDVCDITSGDSFDLDGNGIPDECCTVSSTPQAVAVEFSGQGRSLVINKNRYVSFSGGDPGQQQAIRARFNSLPAPFDILNSLTMWVGPPRPVSTNTGLNDATPPTINMATLQCFPHYTDWSLEGEVHVYHWGIVPGGEIKLQVVREICPQTSETFFSPPLVVSMSKFGDLVGSYDASSVLWTPPNGIVDVLGDVVAIIHSFQNLPGSASKTRSDLQPLTPDHIVDVRDAIQALDAFRGFAFPFAPEALPCAN